MTSNTANTNTFTPAAGLACKKCGVILSENGLGWVRQGYRVSRRYQDGAPCRGTVNRPDVAVRNGGAMCHTCCDEAVEARTEADREKARQTAARLREQGLHG